MDRRSFLSSCAYLAAANTFPLSAPALTEPSPQQVVDVHCHVFNADDLPIVEFIDKVVIPGQPELQGYATDYGHPIRFLVKFLAEWVRNNSKLASDEIRLLDRIANGTAGPARDIASDETKALIELIDNLKNLRIDGKNFTFREHLVSAYLPGIIVGMMHREAFPTQFKGRGYLDNSDNAYDPPSWYPSEYIAGQLYDRVRGPISRYLNWALLFTRNRFEIADALAKVHGGRARLATPALVDYTNWLNDQYDTKLADQVSVMGRIARRNGQNRIHAYAPFDPLREALYRHKSGSSSESPLNLARRAVHEEGFIGVKLYPPMGFMPLENGRKLSSGDFPRHLDSAFRRKLNVYLDEALDDLYAWCLDDQVPILAHASDSNGAEPGYSGRANPENWAPVLKKYSGLRLCLAHFGDFDEGFATKNRPKPQLSDTWEYKMMKLVRDYPQCLVYVDMSYFRAALLSSSNGVRREVVRMFKATRKEFPALPERLLFGTDWIMFGQEENFAPFRSGGKYLDQMFSMLVNDLEFSANLAEQIMFTNAGRFFGFNDSAAKGNRARLKSFYSKYGLDAAWLDQFGIS
jgi:predicted TIM-barrel fold metal-dependent hydrolase